MKTVLPRFLCLCTAALAVLAKPITPEQDVMAHQDKVPGNNDARYDIVPKEDQIFKIDFLEIAPTPILANRVIFVYLRGNLPKSAKKELALPNEGLIDATLTVSLSAVYADGTHDDEKAYTIPLKTTSFNDLAHLTIRDAGGLQVEYMPSSDTTGILVDYVIPAMFLKSGTWTFKVDARLGDAENTCLFAMSLTQWLEGRL